MREVVALRSRKTKEVFRKVRSKPGGQHKQLAPPGLHTSPASGISGLVSCLGNTGSEAGLLLQTGPEHLVMRSQKKEKPEPPTGSSSLLSAVSEPVYSSEETNLGILSEGGREKWNGASLLVWFVMALFFSTSCFIVMLKRLTHFQLVFNLSRE